jgi:hypothetical protein
LSGACQLLGPEPCSFVQDSNFFQMTTVAQAGLLLLGSNDSCVCVCVCVKLEFIGTEKSQRVKLTGLGGVPRDGALR